MTREEAIKHFESYIGNECYTHSHQEACRLAVAALRAQQAPAKLDRSRWEGCRFCGDEEVVEFLLGKKESYCPFCDRPLTKEAEAALKKREEADNETD